MGKSELNYSKIADGTVILDGVSKSFRKQTAKKKSYQTLKSGLIEKLLPSKRKEERQNYFTALDCLDLNLEPGKSVGIIGRNGSGKSTMLKLIAGIYRPDSGKVIKKGKISALIELGAGFHPDFTGRENVYLGGIMYGLSRKEIDGLFDSIVSYAELENSIDDPVKTYSSGMYMRLGFSLAVHTNPDILLIDEVLAVGDAAFIHKCQDTISEFRRLGKTMIFVTHDLDSVVKWCDEAIWLKDGKVQKRGEPKPIIDAYLSEIKSKEEGDHEKENKKLENSTSNDKNWGSKEVILSNFRMSDAQGRQKWIYDTGETLKVEVDFEIKKDIDDLIFGVGILRADGLVVHGVNTEIDEYKLPKSSFQMGEKGVYVFEIKSLELVEGAYFFDIAAHRKDGSPYDYQHMSHKFSVRSSKKVVGVYSPNRSWEVKC